MGDREDSALKNYQSVLQEKQERLTALLQPYQEEPAVQAELSGITLLYEKIRDAKPEIMFYGIYNAGKSSVLNELLGRDEAKVDDIPTTDRIDSYEWNGYRMVDTPGVDAPIEHEKVTEAHLEHADVVLFVISAEGSHEYLENYRRLKAIAARGKKIIIVLNDKEGKLAAPGKGFAELSDEQRQAAAELSEVKRKVAANCRAVGLEDDDYVIVEVNAKRAWTGRVNGKPKLVAMSNIQTLEACIFSELKRMPTFDVLRRAVLEVEEHLARIIEALAQEETSASAQTMNGFLERLHEEKKAARKEVAAYIERRAHRFGRELPSLIWAHRTEGQDAIDKLVQKQQEAFLQDVQRQMQLVLHDLLESLNVAADDLAESIGKLQVATNIEVPLGQPQLSTESITSADESRDTGTDKLRTALDTLQKLLKETGPLIQYNDGKPPRIEDIVATSAKGAAVGSLVGTLAKSLGASTFGKTLAGTAVAPFIASIPPITGPLVIVGLLKSLLGGSSDDDAKRRNAERENERQRRMAEAELQARQELQQRCKYIAEDIGETIRVEVELLVNQIMDDVQRPFKEQAESSKGATEKRLQDLNALRELAGEYEAVRYELGALA